MAPRSISETDPAFAPEPQLELPERSLGEILSHARESAGLDRGQVARELHLSTSIVLALEEDRYGDLPQPAYVRGYIRAYARLLQLDSAPLIERYNEFGFTDPKPVPTPRLPAEESGHRIAKVWGTIGVIAILVGLLVSWWLNQNLGEAFSENPAPADEALIANELALPSGSDEGTVALQLPRTEEMITAITAAASSDSKVPAARGGVTYWTLQPPESPQPTTGTSGPVAPVAEASGERAETGTFIEIAENHTQTDGSGGFDVEPGASLEPPAGSTEDKITVNFDEASWIEIYDANNERLLYGLIDPGARYTLEGEAPFDVVLGNSPGVALSFNGEPFDQSRYDRRNRTARFTVGASMNY